MAVARCCLQRAFTGFSPVINNKFLYLTLNSNTSSPPKIQLNHSRQYSNNFKTMYVEDLRGLPDYEVIKSPPQWKYVERLLAPKTVPKPILKEEYPSGWIPQNPESINHSYFVPRNKNHMVPVYLHLTFRGMRKITKIHKVQGDIWLLSADLKSYLKNKYEKEIIVMRVHELNGNIEVKGDYYYDVKEFLLEKGF